MGKSGNILAIDQGTTSSRAIVFGPDLSVRGLAQREFAQHFPADGWVEHDPEDIWRTTVETARQALSAARLSAGDIAGIGITNQRETCVLWDRRTGQPIHNAIVWQDRRTADLCRALKTAGHEAAVTAKTGLLLDPYFSATKIAWLLQNVEGARASAQAGHLAFGTIDTFLLWRLTGGKVHATDATNASRTLLYDIHKGAFDDDLLRCSACRARSCRRCATATRLRRDRAVDPGAAVPILGIAGDQQAARSARPALPRAWSRRPTARAALRYSTRERTGRLQEPSADNGRLSALRQAHVCAGGLDLHRRSRGAMAARRAAHHRLGQGQQSARRAAIRAGRLSGAGLSSARRALLAAEARGAVLRPDARQRPNELARAALEAVCYQTRDLLDAMRGDWVGAAKSVLRVDGGMVASDWTMQFLADTLDAPVERPTVLETTHWVPHGSPAIVLALGRCGRLRQAVEARTRLQAGARRGGAGAQVWRAGNAPCVQCLQHANAS
jgi:glycerol kinase